MISLCLIIVLKCGLGLGGSAAAVAWQAPVASLMIPSSAPLCCTSFRNALRLCSQREGAVVTPQPWHCLLQLLQHLFRLCQLCAQPCLRARPGTVQSSTNGKGKDATHLAEAKSLGLDLPFPQGELGRNQPDHAEEPSRSGLQQHKCRRQPRETA